MHSHCLGCFLCIAMIKTFFFGLFAILSTMACTHNSTSSSKVIHNRNKVCGKVTWVAGNQMPSPDRPPRVPKGIQREVLVYELTNLKQVTQVNGFYSNIKNKLIISVLSDKNGDFCLELPEGKYSIMVREEGKGLWANIFDGEENIFPFEVKKEKNEPINFVVNYQAAY